jgi:hypothetical protein
MTKFVEIMTIPDVRHKFAHQVSMFSIIGGIALAVMITGLAIYS